MDKIIAVYGVTNSNKMGLALSLAKYIWGRYQIDAEIINTDSRKLYKEFKVSQSLPDKNLFKKINTHLFGEFSAGEPLELFEFKKIVKEKIKEVQERGSLPILVGGSSLHMLCVLQDWQKDDSKKRKKIPANILVFGTEISKKELKNNVKKSVSEMFSRAVYNEFQILYQKAQKGDLSRELLEQTLAYRQFLEVAESSDRTVFDLNSEDLAKAREWIVKDILDYARRQANDYKKFAGIKVVRDFKDARAVVDYFLD